MDLKFLTQKVGPVPVWMYGAGAGGIVLIFLLSAKKKAPPDSTDVTTGSTGGSTDTTSLGDLGNTFASQSVGVGAPRSTNTPSTTTTTNPAYPTMPSFPSTSPAPAAPEPVAPLYFYIGPTVMVVNPYPQITPVPRDISQNYLGGKNYVVYWPDSDPHHITMKEA